MSKQTWLFPDPVIRHEFRVRSQDLHIVTIDGDSMEPLLSSGDRILVDTSQRLPVPPRHLRHLGRHGAGLQAHQHSPNAKRTKIVIKSIDPEYQTDERDTDEVGIVGRVIWAAKRL